MKLIFYPFLQWLKGHTLPDLSRYEIPERPRRNVAIDKGRTTKGTVYQGKEYATTHHEDGTIETTHTNATPKTSAEVRLDKYDTGYLDFVVGVKWKKDESKAKVVKWHWLKGDSAERIEKEHTSTDGKLERGYSERTIADYITAFYDADDNREKDGAARQRPPRTHENKAQQPLTPRENVIEW